MINDPDIFEEPDVAEIIFKQMQRIGINVYKGFNLYELQASADNKLDTVVFRKKADNFEDILSQIEIKKQEILERMQNNENSHSKNNELEINEDGEEQESPEKIL